MSNSSAQICWMWSAKFTGPIICAIYSLIKLGNGRDTRKRRLCVYWNVEDLLVLAYRKRDRAMTLSSIHLDGRSALEVCFVFCLSFFPSRKENGELICRSSGSVDDGDERSVLFIFSSSCWARRTRLKRRAPTICAQCLLFCILYSLWNNERPFRRRRNFVKNKAKYTEPIGGKGKKDKHKKKSANYIDRRELCASPVRYWVWGSSVNDTIIAFQAFFFLHYFNSLCQKEKKKKGNLIVVNRLVWDSRAFPNGLNIKK